MPEQETKCGVPVDGYPMGIKLNNDESVTLTFYDIHNRILGERCVYAHTTRRLKQVGSKLFGLIPKMSESQRRTSAESNARQLIRRVSKASRDSLILVQENPDVYVKNESIGKIVMEATVHGPSKTEPCDVVGFLGPAKNSNCVDPPHKFNTEVLKQFLRLIMCSDPWPVDCDDSKETLLRFANEQAKLLGYNNWVDAYHKL